MKWLVAFLLWFGMQKNIPPSDDPNHQGTRGAPKWCQNIDNEYMHNCDCMSMQDKECNRAFKDAYGRCATSCLKTACKCKTMCDRNTE
jgi:hypothetical protein